MKELSLMHPLEGVPAVAEVVGFYRDPTTCRNIGLELQFRDGHRCKMRYDEIAAAEAAAAKWEKIADA